MNAKDELWKKLNLDVAAFAERVDELASLLEAEPPEDGYAEGSWKLLAAEVLDARHGLWAALSGLDGAAPSNDGSSNEDMLELLARADAELEAELWRLTAINDHRAEKLQQLAPGERGACWWYSRGVHLPQAAVTHLGAVAAVVACFPEAHDELEALRAAEGALRGVERAAEPQASAAIEAIDSKVAAIAAFRAQQERSTQAAALVDDHLDETPRRRLIGPLGWALSAAGVVLALGSGMALKSASEKAEKEKAALVSQAESLKAEADANVMRLEEQLKTSMTMNEAQKTALEQQLASAKSAAASAGDKVKASGNAKAAGAGPVRGAAKPAVKSGSSCRQGDPMCAD
jgi:hypothetical protein